MFCLIINFTSIVESSTFDTTGQSAASIEDMCCVPLLYIVKLPDFKYAVCNTNCAKEMQLYLAKIEKEAGKYNGQKTTRSAFERRKIL